LYATEPTGDVCPLRVASSLPVATSHSLIVLSALPEASVLPSRLYATELTPAVCPRRVARTFGSWTDSGGGDTGPRKVTVANQARNHKAFRFSFMVALCRKPRDGITMRSVPPRRQTGQRLSTDR